MKVSAWQILVVGGGLLFGGSAIANPGDEIAPPLPSSVFSEPAPATSALAPTTTEADVVALPAPVTVESASENCTLAPKTPGDASATSTLAPTTPANASVASTPASGLRPWKPRSTPTTNYGTKASPKVRATVTSRVNSDNDRTANERKATNTAKVKVQDEYKDGSTTTVVHRPRGTHARSSVRGMETVAKTQPRQTGLNNSERNELPTFKVTRVTPGQYGESIADIVAEELRHKQ